MMHSLYPILQAPPQTVGARSDSDADPYPRAAGCDRVAVAGKFFRTGEAKWYCKGLTYGPFAPNDAGEFVPERHRAAGDLRRIAQLGGTAVRVYHVPPSWLLDEAIEAGLRVFIDVPWEKHRCFFEDWSARPEALRQVSRAAADCGNHPAVFALSVANEIPKDIVRFYGAQRIERFVGELLDAARQRAPQCLLTYANYPSTEYLSPGAVDFLCYNVYLEDPRLLGEYLDRLQHQAGPLPLLLGECGLDSYKHGESGQAEGLKRQLSAAFRRGVAGAFVFSYTDDWFAGGHQVERWAFGVTHRIRTDKPAAAALRDAWVRVPQADDESPLPRASVVVCSYNGAATLDECLASLVKLDYPNYEVVLVDDGSTDDTPTIAAKYPRVRYIRQDNFGLSVARNVGARAASGDVVAYTDSDCVADDQWLRFLVTAMRDQKVQAVGGPNVPPPQDRWVAKCVAASPGGPSHVMLDDRYAEHVPGCNMAFDRIKLLELGGFDPQFRIAGDDVDICWRFTDASLKIGYAPAALVWHHRRGTARAYLRQQKGYGRAEAILQLKHPARFSTTGRPRWHGIIYGEGAIGLPLRPQKTFHGIFGAAPFQIVYRHNQYSGWSYCTLFEWHAMAAMLLVASAAWRPLAAVAAAMWLLTTIAVLRSASRAPLPGGAPWWGRPLVAALHLLQPIARTSHRYAYRLGRRRIQAGKGDQVSDRNVQWKSRRVLDLYWRSREGRGREHLLGELTVAARGSKWFGIYDAEWERWDVTLLAGPWNTIRVYTATEELGGEKRFTRARCVVSTSGLTRAAAAGIAVWTIAAVAGRHPWAIGVAAAAWLGLGIVLVRNGRRCLRAAAALVCRAGLEARLDPVSLTAPAPSSESSPHPTADPEPATLLPG